MYFGHGVKENLRWPAWGLGRWWSFTLGTGLLGGRTEVLGARHSWGRHGGESGGLKRGLYCLLAIGRKSFLVIEQIYSKLWLKWWAICSDLWLLALSVRPPLSSSSHLQHSLNPLFFFFPEDNLQHAPRVRRKVGENKSFVKRTFTTSWFKEKKIIHKALVHSRNDTKSPKHCLTHSKSELGF